MRRTCEVPLPPPAFDLAACERLMRGGSKSFFAASLVLPARVRAPATALYAFCRVADDTVDVDAARHGGPDGAMRHLHQRLDRIYGCIAAGHPLPADAAPVDHALHSVVNRFAIPAALPLALLDGFAWDMAGRRYETLAELHDYAARVAGSVGAMMARVMGVDDADALARACELGVAMQLTNIARDVGEDARLGRLYLPRTWLRDAGIDPDAWLQAPCFSPALAGVVERLLADADALYRRAEAGVAALPRDCRVAILAARLVYAEIGREVERAGFDSVGQRAVVGAHRKLALMARAWSTARWLPEGRPGEAALPAIRFLVDAAAAASRRDAAQASVAMSAARPPKRRSGPPSRPLGERVDWTISLFERVRERRLAAQTGNGSVNGGEARGSAYGG